MTCLAREHFEMAQRCAALFMYIGCTATDNLLPIFPWLSKSVLAFELVKTKITALEKFSKWVKRQGENKNDQECRNRVIKLTLFTDLNPMTGAKPL